MPCRTSRRVKGDGRRRCQRQKKPFTIPGPRRSQTHWRASGSSQDERPPLRRRGAGPGPRDQHAVGGRAVVAPGVGHRLAAHRLDDDRRGARALPRHLPGTARRSHRPRARRHGRACGAPGARASAGDRPPPGARGEPSRRPVLGARLDGRARCSGRDRGDRGAGEASRRDGPAKGLLAPTSRRGASPAAPSPRGSRRPRRHREPAPRRSRRAQCRR